MKERRRELLRALTLGGGAVAVTQLPSNWSRPVVDRVLLPAHAVTSGPVLSGTLQLSDSGNSQGGPLQLLVAEAVAGPSPPTVQISHFAFCQAIGDDMVRVQYLRSIFESEGDTGVAAEVGTQYAQSGREQGRLGILDSVVSEARALGFISCYVQQLYQFELELGKTSSGQYASAQVPLGSPADSCGSGNVPVEMGQPSIQVLVDHPAYPTSGSVVYRVGAVAHEIAMTSGGAPLVADCFGMACEPLIPSDRAIKEGFSPVQSEAVLAGVVSLQLGCHHGMKPAGLSAREFHAAFGLGDGVGSIPVVDLNGVTLSSIQALHRLAQEADDRMERIEADLAVIREHLV